jgi:hypothetical protein
LVFKIINKTVQGIPKIFGRTKDALDRMEKSIRRDISVGFGLISITVALFFRA